MINYDSTEHERPTLEGQKVAFLLESTSRLLEQGAPARERAFGNAHYCVVKEDAAGAAVELKCGIGIMLPSDLLGSIMVSRPAAMITELFHTTCDAIRNPLRAWAQGLFPGADPHLVTRFLQDVQTFVHDTVMQAAGFEERLVEEHCSLRISIKAPILGSSSGVAVISGTDEWTKLMGLAREELENYRNSRRNTSQ